MTTRADRYWTVIIILLLAIIITGSIVTWSGYGHGRALEISLAPEQEIQGEIYIDGRVNSPGLYLLKADDTLEDIIGSAGGVTGEADLTRLKLHVPGAENEEQTQKIDINRAESWLLEALPGIGETRAQAIIDYRRQNGPFRNINELTKVEGIGTTTYEKLKHLVTAAD